MKLKIFIILLIVLALTIANYSTLKSSKKMENILIIGTASGYAPWVSANTNGELEGFDIDVINEIAKKLNKKLIIKDLGSMPALFIALEQNKIDAVITSSQSEELDDLEQSQRLPLNI